MDQKNITTMLSIIFTKLPEIHPGPVFLKLNLGLQIILNWFKQKNNWVFWCHSRSGRCIHCIIHYKNDMSHFPVKYWQNNDLNRRHLICGLTQKKPDLNTIMKMWRRGKKSGHRLWPSKCSLWICYGFWNSNNIH